EIFIKYYHICPKVAQGSSCCGKVHLSRCVKVCCAPFISTIPPMSSGQMFIPPVLRASITSGTLFILGDVITQTSVEPYVSARKSLQKASLPAPPKIASFLSTISFCQIDWTRTARFGLFRGLHFHHPCSPVTLHISPDRRTPPRSLFLRWVQLSR